MDMSTKLKAVETPDAQAESPPEFTEELPPLSVDPTSFDARIAGIEPCSVVREFSKHWSTVSAYEIERAVERGEVSREDEREARREAWRRRWEPIPNDKLEEHIQYIKRTAARFIDWGDLGQLWNADPRAAIDLWRAIRLEARDEFVSGHYGAGAFEVGDYMHAAFKRAQYLSVRDGLIDEWKPRGATEFILIDQMTQAYVMQLHWTEQAMLRSQAEPRVETYEFTEWKRQRKLEAKVNQWEMSGRWDIPYQHKADAIEQAFRLVELCSKAFQRAARQLANIRLVRAKTARARRRDRAHMLKPVRSGNLQT
jgi:hypothetical protein